MKLRFTKMHGAGNDFIVLDATRGPLPLSAAQYRFLADRRFGIGADQILIVEPGSAEQNTDFTYRIINADGGEVEQCGNGARCFARYVHDQHLTTKTHLRVQTMLGVIEPQLQDDGRVTVDMSNLSWNPRKCPSTAPASRPSWSTVASCGPCPWPTTRWTWPWCPWATRTRCCAWTMSIMPP
jgi:diaminopimelate epimerase